jgi:hypothetical protein
VDGSGNVTVTVAKQTTAVPNVQDTLQCGVAGEIIPVICNFLPGPAVSATVIPGANTTEVPDPTS